MRFTTVPIQTVICAQIVLYSSTLVKKEHTPKNNGNKTINLENNTSYINNIQRQQQQVNKKEA